MNATELAALVAAANETLASRSSPLPSDFNLTAVMNWITMINGTKSFNETLAAALHITPSELAIAASKAASKVANATLPVVITTLKPALNATNAKKKAELAQLAAKKAMLEFLKDRFHTLQLFLLAGYGIMFLLCIILILYLRFNRNVAFRGDMNAARKVILPAFEPLLIVLAFATGTYVVFFCYALATNLYTYTISKLATEVFYSGRQFVFLSIVVFMLQTSVSGPALRRSVLVTFILATYTLPIVWYMVKYGNPNHFYTVLTVARSLMLLLYTYIFIRPPGRASKRTIREFCIYTYVYYALLFTYNDLFRQNKLIPGFNLTYANLLWGSMCPLVIWRVLKADTEHWRGMGQRAVALQSLFRQKNNLPERVSSKGLHVLIEMHRKYIIDFAYLELKARIGMGASAVVFNGILRSKIPVAVKVYTPSDFTEETVAEFSQEAALCGALHHPNIVRFYGMCVCPPTICLVSELCQGSLEDVTCAMARRTHHTNRQQLLINIAYMLDAARAVTYIHSFSPSFLHRDIKPANFLVDAENTVKLTDFGESRSLPRTQVAPNKYHMKQTSFKPGYVESGGTSHRESVQLSSGAGIQQVRKSEMELGNRLTIKGTVDYMAPEIINGKGGQALYGEAADVYSLGITMWDILYPGQEKYPQVNGNQFKIFEAVTDGQRPVLDQDVHATLRMVIETAWHSDARLRPSAQNVVSILETIQEEIAAIFAMELSDELEEEMVMSKHGGHIEQSFTGEHAVDQMEELHYVSTPSEAIRIGNALMDAGLLHHVKHARPFENTNAMYYFDEDNINLCQPIENGGGGGYGPDQKKLSDDEMSIQTGSTRRSRRTHTHASSSTHGNQLSEHMYGSASTHSDQLLVQNGVCSCRKLGQRLTLPKAQSRRRFRRNKYKTIAEENILQASLLNEDHTNQPDLLRHSHSNDFEDFDTVGSAA